MATLTIGDKSVTIDDGFLKLSPEEQNATVAEIAASMGAKPEAPAYDRNDPALKNQDTRALLRGVPVVGPMATNRAAAGLRSLVNGGTYAENLAQEDAAQKDFEKEHPVLDAVAGGIGGTLALGGFGGLVPAAARAMGMTGALRTAVPAAISSGGAIGAADAVARGEDPSRGAVAGALTGAGGVVVGKGLGKAFDAAGRAFGREAPVAQRTIDVAGEQVPVRESVVTRSPDTSMDEQNMLRGSRGAPAQEVAQAAEEATAAAMERAHGRVASSLDQTGASPSATPLAGGDAVANDLVSRESQRAAAEVARVQQIANEGAGIRADVEPVGPQSAPIPEQPQQAGQQLLEGLARRREVERANTNAMYEARNAVPGEFEPRFLLRAGDQIRENLNVAPGDQRVRISPEVTPTAQTALNTIDQELAGLRFTNDAARGARPITPADIDQVRKQLVILRRQANTAARNTGNWEDARAMGRVMSEFDNFIAQTAERPGGFSGDSAAYLQADRAARGQHAYERSLFSRQGPGDKVGTTIENMLGKYAGQEMSPDKVISTLLGSPTSPGGVDHAVATLRHLQRALGETSPEWAALKKAAISHFTEPVPGTAALTPAQQGDRMARFLANERHSGALFTDSERARLMQHANRLRSAVDPVPDRGTVEQKIAVLSGRHTGEAASGNQVIEALSRSDGGKLAAALRNEVSPESWALLKQGMFQKVSKAVEDATPWGSQRTAETITKFLATDLAREMYTPNERALMKALADAHHQLVPIPGTVNTSGTAHTAARLATGLRHQLLGLFGFSHGGLPGAGLALALGKGLEWGVHRRAAGQATARFYGEQPRRAGSTAAQRALVTAAQVPALQHPSK